MVALDVLVLASRVGTKGGRMIAQAAEAFGLGVLGAAFLFGFRHGIDWDHIAAITDITSSQEERSASMLFGTIYALGHALVVFLIGSSAILHRCSSSPRASTPSMERIVGVTLVILGVFVFVVADQARPGIPDAEPLDADLLRDAERVSQAAARSARRRGERADRRRHVHSDADPVHVHAEEGVALAVADDLPVSEWHHGHHGRPGHHHHKHPEPTTRS